MRVLPVQPPGEAPPPLSRDEQLRAYSCQAQLAEERARHEVDASSLVLSTSTQAVISPPPPRAPPHTN